MADNMLEIIAKTMVRGRDRALGELARFVVNRLNLARYGEMTHCGVDSPAREIRVSLLLKGEPEIIEARIVYRLERNAGKTRLIAENIWVSREWVSLLFNDLAQSRGGGMELPTGAALAVKILGL